MKKLGLMANYALAGMVLSGLAVCAVMWYAVGAVYVAGCAAAGLMG